jgi:tetratricopeptide (TPR) repeat protein
MLAVLLAAPHPAAAVGGTTGRIAVENGPARALPDAALAPSSLAMQSRGEAQLAARDLNGATDSFEAALAADPRNARAFIGLARVAEAQNMPGAAIGWYRRALALDPANRELLALQGEAMARRGARARAEANLQRLRELCGTTGPCPEADRLAAAIARPAPAATAAAATSAQP